MWLAETAVNTRTLEILAEHGIRFTILAPHQAAKVRKIGEGKWTPLKGAGVDPQTAYVRPLPSGKKIHLFFYDGPIAQEVAFADLLKSGVDFANRLLGVFRATCTIPSSSISPPTARPTAIITVSVKWAWLIACIMSFQRSRAGDHLRRISEKFPATHEIQIVENTSWSCVHGEERWRSDCGWGNWRATAGGTRSGARAAASVLTGLRDTLLAAL